MNRPRQKRLNSCQIIFRLLIVSQFPMLRWNIMLCADIVIQNMAFNRTAYQSSTYNNQSAGLAVDGIITNSAQSCSSTLNDLNPWLTIDLGMRYFVSSVQISSYVCEYHERMISAVCRLFLICCSWINLAKHYLCSTAREDLASQQFSRLA